jgi:putative peptidoglycan lipid II flippase
VRKLGRLSLFVIGYVVANQIGFIVAQWLANQQQGGYSAYTYAFMFFMLPHGLFAVSVITALLPGMSELAANQRWVDFRQTLSTGMRATIFLVLPAAIGYFVLGKPIVRLIIEHGVAGAESTELVAAVLRLFVLGLVPFSLFQLFLRAFYSIQDTKTPFVINCGAVALNTAINVPMFAAFGVQGLAAGHAIAYVFGVSVQGWVLSRRIGGIDGRRVVDAAVRIAAAAVGMGVIVWVVHRVTDAVMGDTAVGDIAAVGVPVGVGALAYLVLSHLVRVQELRFATNLLGRRFARKPQSDGGGGR